MILEFGNNKEIDFNQDFFNVETEMCRIHRFSIFQMTPANLFNQEIEYFTITDNNNEDIAFLGAKWSIINGKTLKAQTRLAVSKGDLETIELVAQELLARISKCKIEQLKEKKSSVEK